VYDGFRHQRPSTTTTEDIRPIQYDDDKKSSLRLVPFTTGDAWGVGVTWER